MFTGIAEQLVSDDMPASSHWIGSRTVFVMHLCSAMQCKCSLVRSTSVSAQKAAGPRQCQAFMAPKARLGTCRDSWMTERDERVEDSDDRQSILLGLHRCRLVRGSV